MPMPAESEVSESKSLDASMEAKMLGLYKGIAAQGGDQYVAFIATTSLATPVWIKGADTMLRARRAISVEGNPEYEIGFT